MPGKGQSWKSLAVLILLGGMIWCCLFLARRTTLPGPWELLAVVPSWVFLVIGGLLGILWLPLLVWALVHFRRRNRFWGPPDELVTDGPYSQLRHPQYVGSFSVLVGFGLLLDETGLLLAGALIMLLGLLLIGLEERLLLRRFGAEYADYRRRTPKLIFRPSRMARVISGIPQRDR